MSRPADARLQAYRPRRHLRQSTSVLRFQCLAAKSNRTNAFAPELNDGPQYIVGLYGPSILSKAVQFNPALKCKLPSVGFLYISSDNIEEFQRQAADFKEAFKSGMGFALDEALYQTPLNH